MTGKGCGIGRGRVRRRGRFFRFGSGTGASDATHRALSNVALASRRRRAVYTRSKPNVDKRISIFRAPHGRAPGSSWLRPVDEMIHALRLIGVLLITSSHSS